MARPQESPKLRLVGGGRGEARAFESEPPESSARASDGIGTDQGADHGAADEETSDAQLVALTASGQRDAFEGLYRRHSAFALGLAIRIQGGASDVEDVVHDAFVQAHTRLADLKEPSAFRAWLGSIVVRLVRTRLRKRRLLNALGLASPDPVDLDSIASSDATTEQRVLLAQVYALLQTLPASDRIAWTLRYIEKHRLEAVAELMGCSLATAKRRILRAQRFLAGHFVPAFSKDSGDSDDS
ncbi:MAG TPA: sigma-70 family RNA polymerase sigma factor [Polyangiaceae bacterium]|nr:sigma-70 family RNA polymerase sigma factor [Polyangiaceae bacterium]